MQLLKNQFPIFQKHPDLVYLDNGATTQKPNSVINGISNFYSYEYGTTRRGVYTLSSKSTQYYEETREKVAKLIHAESPQEVVYTKGSTESINLIAFSYGLHFLDAGDEILISTAEHHANITPWQMVCEKVGAILKIIPIDNNGDLDESSFNRLLNHKTKIVAITHVSNVLGTVMPIKKITQAAHRFGAVVLVDGAQAIAHIPVNVQDLDADFYVFSSHKAYGPTGVGILYGKKELLELIPPYQRGGDMVNLVTFEKTTYQDPPHRFEAGTPPIAQVVGLGYAIDFLLKTTLEVCQNHDQELLKDCTLKLEKLPYIKIIGTSTNKSGVISFTMDKIHPHDIGTLLDQESISVRAGHHCAQPLMQRYGLSATTRASFGLSNTKQDIDLFINALDKVYQMFNSNQS